MNKILQYLKKHGERLDTDIAEATEISLAVVCFQLAELAAKFEVACHSVRFIKGKRVEGVIYRIAGYTHRRAGNQRHVEAFVALALTK
ncbi:MAG: ArsR family transcriptional regulator [Gallionella sp.]|jgi:hypothetical protein|nr:ArsR family transcriptional regulator [Gallionella sp.]